MSVIIQQKLCIECFVEYRQYTTENGDYVDYGPVDFRKFWHKK